MAIAHSKLTAQGQISVPADVRRKLGLGPGSVLEWDQVDDHIVVRKAGRHTCADVHAVLFEDRPLVTSAPSDTTKEGIRKYIRRKHARR